MKKENFLDSNKASLEDKVKDNKLRLLNLRGDKEHRKLKNVKEVLFVRRETARLFTALQKKMREEKVAQKLKETVKEENPVSSRGSK